ncbi:MAG: beta-ketoacyl-ACP synthase III [Desulfobacteraceae bacterium]
MKKSVIRGTGRSLPTRLVTNKDLEKIMETSDEWIRQRTGIEQRYWVEENEIKGVSDLGYEASVKAVEKAGWAFEDIDLIIFATLSPDIFFPGPGCLLQAKLGLKSTPALDIRQQCTGFLYGMATADAFIKSGMYGKILFVGAEIHSTGLDKTTRGRDIAVLFGDGGAAVCLEADAGENDSGIIASTLHADGRDAESLATELPASRLPDRLPIDRLKAGDGQYPTMDGKNIFKKAVKKLPQVTYKTLEKAGLKMEDIDLVIPHQANLRINQAYQEIMKLPEEKIYNNIQKYGNTTAASIPLALDEAIEKGLTGQKGDTVLFSGFGAGLTWGCVIYRF